ncbi:hypothetical protein OH76DRAFT_1490829 [Lentinus brumalis]|uniref:Mitochondrial carrier n=1 Tax=Lentinus brumalis TaxID=2498619 RepID=A0A371CHF6_9APHY|nr:hypothetical protein OH76DRAFT_1490880 [Polyporus brumalis]RDX39791.1 hypothetical protein OH76DRAFT_1490829 [Polyporus brumalis]
MADRPTVRTQDDLSSSPEKKRTGGTLGSVHGAFDLGGTLKDALGGSLNEAVVMVMQVLALMPLHTIMNHQYRYGGAPPQATKTLYADGGWTRFYQGLAAALVQGPVSRFCDAVASVGVLALLKGNKYTRDLPALARAIFVSLTAPA